MAETSARKLADIVDASGNVDVNAGTIDGADITVGSGKTLDVSAGTLTLANDQISGDKVEGGTIAATTITTLTSTTISAGNVGIGTTSPAQPLHLRSAAPAIEFDDSGFSTVRGRIYSNEGSLLFESDYNNSRYGSNIAFNVDNSERMRIDSSGNVELKTTNAKLILPSGGGISFENHSVTNASGASSTASANVLDDYEEGTWTPAFEGSIGTIGDTAYTERGGRYTKIGNRVILNFTMGLSSKGSWSGYVRITGVPFNCIGALSGDEAVGALEIRYTVISEKYFVLDLGRFSTSTLAIFGIDSNAASSQLLVSNVGDNGFFRATIAYTSA